MGGGGGGVEGVHAQDLRLKRKPYIKEGMERSREKSKSQTRSCGCSERTGNPHVVGDSLDGQWVQLEVGPSMVEAGFLQLVEVKGIAVGGPCPQ